MMTAGSIESKQNQNNMKARGFSQKYNYKSTQIYLKLNENYTIFKCIYTQ